jgi:hypothetical protein
LGQIETTEMIEAQLVNSVAPLCYATAFRNNEERQYRKTHHKCFSNGRKVSSLFLKKTIPHTNMAKAALNMLTHTSSGTLKDGIFMNAVDTGLPMKILLNCQKKQELEDFQPTLDIVDGATRNGPFVVLTQNIGGKFLKIIILYRGNTLGLLLLSKYSMCSCS